MELDEFISETLSQISAGIEKTNANGKLKESIANVGIDRSINGIEASSGGNTLVVRFDVAITTESSEKGGAKLNVAGIGGFGGTTSAQNQVASRVQFDIPLWLRAFRVSVEKSVQVDRGDD